MSGARRRTRQGAIILHCLPNLVGSKRQLELLIDRPEQIELRQTAAEGSNTYFLDGEGAANCS